MFRSRCTDYSCDLDFDLEADPIATITTNLSAHQ